MSPPLTFEEFSQRSVPTKTPDGPLLLWASGLGGESAEVAEAMLDLLALVVASGGAQDAAKKIERDQGGHDVHGLVVDREVQLLKEAGDVLFYLDKLLCKRGLTLELAALALIEKLDGMRS